MNEDSSRDLIQEIKDKERVDEGSIDRLERLIEKFILNAEKMQMAEYIELFNSPKRLIYFNFVAGLARGFGIAIGLTLLGAIFLSILYRLADLNLPLIGEYIAHLVRIVQQHL
ncbi:DUF5665 domain-containing protein [Natroniella sulfidigena]|uniref:DUF5665 domain-containing protein n=1 Tax=Natroniella sulfidigena TaxID=723921 RepID=UPI00200A400A|nr:DUF5665 domain-containing protein [Natroniella sulfidigena]MCK8817801.1 DUF5665 domain-containing protein [Natroniella sulfidigena]